MKHTVTLALTLFCLTSFAQDRGFRSEGREFYLGYLHPSFTNQPAGSNSWTLDLQYLRSGAYTAVITIGGETLTRRLIIE